VLFRESDVHFDRGGEAGEERRVQVGPGQLEVRQVREPRWSDVYQSGVCMWMIPHLQHEGVRSLVGDNDRAQSGVPPNEPCAGFSATPGCGCEECHEQNWTALPSPPEAAGWNVGFPKQFTRRSHEEGP
jgi:hypothetical protein